MSNLLAFLAAIVISMVLTPLMSRVASRFGLVDFPSERKVHTTPVPRVGGVGIVIGTLVPVMLLLVPDQLIQSYVFGASVLFVFGLWDDAFEIGHYPKFVGQIIAALIVILYGGLYVSHFPFLPGGIISPESGIPFTLVAIVGMVNAMNHSDGLDGLAGGESLFSLGAVALLTFFSAGGLQTLTIAVATIGGILGFLRYNTHPARVFMGDSGSQFIGFTLAFLVILLTQRVDPSLSPAVALLLLGLPIADILVVLAKRASHGKNLFRATCNHIHHRLLNLGFLHRESVIIIYSLQMIFVTTGILMRYEDNFIIIATYLLYCLLIFVTLGMAERAGWKFHRPEHGRQPRLMSHQFSWNVLVILPRRFLAIGVSVFLVTASLFIVKIPSDFAEMSLLVAFLIAVDLFTGYGQHTIMRRLLIYIIAAQVGFLWIYHRPVWSNYAGLAEVIVFALMAIAFIVAVKFSPRRRKIEFELTATDYLVAFSVLAVLITSKAGLWDVSSVAFVVQMVVILYSCELLITENRGKWSWLSAASMVAGLVLGVRGLFLG